MSEGVIMALIAAAGSFLGVVITVIGANKKNAAEMKATLSGAIAEIKANQQTAQAVTDTKITELTREVREHNNFARRMPVIEEKMTNMEHRLEKANI